MADRLNRLIQDIRVGIDAWHHHDGTRLINRRRALTAIGTGLIESTAAVGLTIAALRTNLIGNFLHRVIVDPIDYVRSNPPEILVPDTVTFAEVAANPESFVEKNWAGIIIEDAVAHYIGTMPIQDNLTDVFLLYSRNDLGGFVPGQSKAIIATTYHGADLPPKIPYFQDIPTITDPHLNPDYPHPALHKNLIGIYDMSQTKLSFDYGISEYDKKNDTEHGREQRGIEDAVKNEWDNPQFISSVVVRF